MNSKEYFVNIVNTLTCYDKKNKTYTNLGDLTKYINSLNKRLEMLEEEYNNLKKDYDVKDLECVDLQLENEKFKKAFNKACLMLDWCCPVEQDLIDDLDCENRCSGDLEELCRECWKIYFLKEVKKNER